jgi:glutamyl/glutaminyl-tRNA synthetase
VERKYINRESFDRGYLVSLVRLFQPRLTVVNDFTDWADFFFVDEPNIEEEAKNKFLSGDLSREFGQFIEKLANLEKFDILNIEGAFRELVKELNIESKALIHPLRVALTGKTIGPGLFEVVYYLGKERVKNRLSRWIKGGSNA